jgi:Transmembrane secretion effector
VTALRAEAARRRAACPDEVEVDTLLSWSPAVGERVRLFGGLGQRFGWLWAAYAVSAYGTWLGFGAFSFVAITVLHASTAEVAAMSASGLAVGALVAVPMGPWVEFRRKRPVMIAMDLMRFGAQASIPIAYAFGVLTIVQLICVSIVLSAANVAFTAATGAFLKALVEPGDLLAASVRFESTTWSASVVGPTLGGAAIGLLGPVVTIAADAVSYLLSALGITAIRGGEPAPASAPSRLALAGLAEGWRYFLHHRQLRRLFLNSMVVNGLIMAGEAPLAVLMLGQLGFRPWQYGLAFAVPCVGGLIGSRLARPLAARYGNATVLRVFGLLRCCWPLGLVLVRPGPPGLVIVITVELALIICCSIVNPIMATYRLQAVDHDRVSRVLAAWSVSSTAARAALIALWGVLATVTSPRWALAAAGALLLATPLLLPLGIGADIGRGKGERRATAAEAGAHRPARPVPVPVPAND